MTSARVTDEDMSNVFDLFDSEGVGTLRKDELLFALRSLGWPRLTEADVHRIVSSVRSDGGTTMTKEQFLEVAKKRQKIAEGPEEILAAFRLFDQSNTGKVTPDDICRAGLLATGAAVPDALVAEIMRYTDIDGDGSLSLDEFRRAVTAHRPLENLPKAKALKVAQGLEAAAKQANATAAAAALAQSSEPRDTKAKTPPPARKASPPPAAVEKPKEPAAVEANSDKPSDSKAAEEPIPVVEISVEDTTTQKNEEPTTTTETDTELAAVPTDGTATGENVVTKTILGKEVSFVDGKISKEEARLVMYTMNFDDETLTQDDFNSFFGDADKDEDGHITVDEFCLLLVGLGEIIEGY